MKKTARPPIPFAWPMLYAAWLVALIATLGALFVGEVMGQTPCSLCWHQRIAMFPLALILGIACLREDAGVQRYALPLALAGGVVSLWHNLVYFDIAPKALEPCGEGASCAGAEMTIFGGLPLPTIALVAFAAITLLLIRMKPKEPK